MVRAPLLRSRGSAIHRVRRALQACPLKRQSLRGGNPHHGYPRRFELPRWIAAAQATHQGDNCDSADQPGRSRSWVNVSRRSLYPDGELASTLIRKVFGKLNGHRHPLVGGVAGRNQVPAGSRVAVPGAATSLRCVAAYHGLVVTVPTYTRATHRCTAVVRCVGTGRRGGRKTVPHAGRGLLASRRNASRNGLEVAT